MTVRWKPLMILSGLFLVVALVGVIAITVAMMPRSAQDIVKVARTAREAGQFDNAAIHYQRALQVDPRNAAIHEDFAGLYRDWSRQATDEQRPVLRAKWLEQTDKAVKYDKVGAGPASRAASRCHGPGADARRDLLGRAHSWTSSPMRWTPTTSWPPRRWRSVRRTSPRSSGTSR